MWPFDKPAEKKVNEASEHLDRRIDGLIQSEQAAHAKIVQLEKELGESRQLVTEQATKIRAQTEADLYLISAKIMRDIMERGKPMDGDAAKQAALQAQLRHYGPSTYSGNYFSNAGQSLFGSIFG